MNSIKFFKYQGAGNDFIIIDNRDSQFPELSTKEIAQLCDRRFGIGADGFMLLQNSKDSDFEMVYYNADGNIGSMCGNGGRCIVAFAKKLGIIKGATNFLAVDGMHNATINESGDWISLKMQDVNHIDHDGDDYVLNTGSPHYVRIVSDLKNMNVASEGASIRNNNTYQKEGINVNFAAAENKGYFVRTFERGVEDETLACGTGATAVALAMALHHKQTGNIETPIRVLGGDLSIRFRAEDEHFTDIFLEGPAKFVFEGTIEIS